MRNCRFSVVRTGALTLAVFGLLCSLAFAAVEERRTLELKLGGSDLLKTTHPFKRVSIADPAIADVVVLSPKEMYVFGKKVGYTSMILWAEGKGKTLLDVVVSLDLTALKAKLHELYPDQKIEVYGTETGVVLSGTVSGPEVVEQVLRLTQTYLPKQAKGSGSSSSGSGTSGVGITNLLNVGAIQQVMLEVKFAEVQRSSGMNWQAALGMVNQGEDLNIGAGAFPLGLDNSVTKFGPDGTPVTEAVAGALPTFGAPGSLLLNFADNAANIFANINNLTAALQFLETENLSRTLAEPRLVTLSGQEASFLAGGEFPFQTIDQDGRTDVEFKDFGVGLKFTPVVHSDGKITLRVTPSVSDIVDFVQTSTGPQAVFDTRQLESTVQLHDGQTLALAGLLKENMVNQVSKVPGLGDIPVLGALFRSSSYLNEKTDLLIAITPHIVKPVKEGSLAFPGAYLAPPNRLEFYLEGRLEGRRSADATSALGEHSFMIPEPAGTGGGGLEGEFGLQPATAQ